MADPAPRRWFRFRLRTLLILVAVVAVPLAWIGKERRQSRHERNVADELARLGFSDLTLGGPYDSWKLDSQSQPQGWPRNLARRILGERILWLTIHDSDFDQLALLADLSNLQVLGLQSTRVRELTPLAGLTSLERLQLKGSLASDLTPLAGLTNLQYLDLSGTRAHDIAPLARLVNLEWLDLGFTPVSDVSPLAGLKKLKSLGLDSTQVGDIAPLAHLERLQSVNLRGTTVRDLSPLEKLANLNQVSLYLTPAPKEQVEALRQALPNCKITPDPLSGP